MNMVSEFEFVKSKYSILIINLVIFAICRVRFDRYNYFIMLVAFFNCTWNVYSV